MSDPTPTIQAMLDEAERATKGPWSRVESVSGFSVHSPDYRVLCIGNTGYKSPHPRHAINADFIAHARENVPALCKALIAAVECMEGVAFYVEDARAEVHVKDTLIRITKHLEARDGK